MKRKLDDNTGLWLKDAVEGQFEVVEKDDYSEMFLCDNKRNFYKLHTVTILSSQFSRYEGEIDFPKPFRVKPDGTIIETGAKVLIIFPMGKTKPVVLGCLNRLGSQNKNVPGLQIGADNLRRKKKRSINDDSSYERIQDEDGVRQSISDGSYSVNVTGGNASLQADATATIEGKQIASLLGDIVEIGGNLSRLKTVPDDNHKNKATSIRLYGKEVVIGHSNDTGRKIKVDRDKTIDKPILQNMVMGVTLEALLDLFVEILETAKYTGSGVYTMMPSSILELKKRVRERLPKIKSKIGFILYKPEQVKGQDDPLGED